MNLPFLVQIWLTREKDCGQRLLSFGTNIAQLPKCVQLHICPRAPWRNPGPGRPPRTPSACTHARERATAAGLRARLAATHSAAGRASASWFCQGLLDDSDKAITFIDLEPKSSMVSLDECDSPG